MDSKIRQDKTRVSASLDSRMLRRFPNPELMEKFPNPERIGCPSNEILANLAHHRMTPAEAERWAEHVTTCSPCYRYFCQLREEALALRRTRVLWQIAASLLVATSLLGWFLFRLRNDVRVAQSATVDLRDRALSRGIDTEPAQVPLELTRNVSRISFLLPPGTPEGPYEVDIETPSGDLVLKTNGVAQLTNRVIELRASMNLSSLAPGTYLLEIHEQGFKGNSYHLILK